MDIGMLRFHGRKRAAAYVDIGQHFCSRQMLSTDIHVGNTAVSWMKKSSGVYGRNTPFSFLERH